MSYKEEFNDDTDWSIIDTNIRLNHSRARGFVQFLKDNDVTTIIRYYANDRSNSKTLTPDEAKFLSENGFGLITIFQQNNRENRDFGADNGRRNAEVALRFAERIGQPENSALFFAVDSDFKASSGSRQISHVLPYFEAVKNALGGDFRIGAYGSGFVLKTLMDEELIEIPWLSMSRLFTGTREFFENGSWALRQIPLSLVHPFGSSPRSDQVRTSRRGDRGVFFDKNALNVPLDEIGSFRVDSNRLGELIGEVAAVAADATLGGGESGIAVMSSVVDVEALSGANAFVKTEGLNFRRQPDGAVIRSLTIGEPVNNLGAHPDDPNWSDVQIGGERGVVFAKFLRQPRAPEIETLLSTTVAEWVRFDKGRALEHRSPFFEFVGEMWEALGRNLDGRDRDVPWSAAFVSFVVRAAGEAYRNFKFSASHSQFVHDAIHARNIEDQSKPYWGFRVSEAKPEIGDIIHRNRGGNRFSFDFAENHEFYASHSDVVVEVTPEVVRVIGGNVGHTVSMQDSIQEYDLDDDGFLIRNQADGQRIITLLRNRAREVS